jgi:hypothetical protein
MRATLDRMESDLADARRRAEAWAVGDVDALRERGSGVDQEACWSALQQSPKIAAVRQQFEDGWFKLAVEAVEKHDVALAVVPISELFGRNGVIAKMQASTNPEATAQAASRPKSRRRAEWVSAPAEM